MGGLIHFFRGYVRIKVWGYSPERFMNLCGNRDILMWDVEKRGDCYMMCLSLSGFRKLRPIVRKTKTKVAVLKKCGLPFLLDKIKKRNIFILGLAGCFLFLHVMSGFIWSVHIEGNHTVSNETFCEYLKEKEICPGTSIRRIDIEKLEKEIRKDFPIVTWTSAKIDGTLLTIKVKENEHIQKEKDDNDQNGQDIVADKSGILVSMITRNGVPLVKISDSIKAGDVLVSGAIPIYGEDMSVKDYLLCKADADIYMQCVERFSGSLSDSYEYRRYTGIQGKYPYVSMFGKEWKCSFSKNKGHFREYVKNGHQIQLLNQIYFPVEYGSYRYREYTLEKKKYTKQEAEKLCRQKIDRIEQTLKQKGVQIIEKDVKIEKKSSQYIWKADFTVVEKTGVLAWTTLP